ncbi:MAG: MnhB domain-containing protein, partial [Saccharopolyspora rectivirgula]
SIYLLIAGHNSPGGGFARRRMAGLAQRHGGQTFGWDALQPPPNRADPTK